MSYKKIKRIYESESGKKILPDSKLSTRVPNQLLSMKNFSDSKLSNLRPDIEILNKLLPMSKRSQSEIVSTVILILIVLASAAIIISFVVPFVKDRLSGSGCLDVANQIKIVDSQYTCYMTDEFGSQILFVQVHIGKNDSIKGFTISLGGASSSNYNVIPGELDNVYPYLNGNLELPGENQERTYMIYSVPKPDSITVYPILENGKTCEGDTINVIEDCSF